MGEITGIAWTDHTFNPWIGCTKVHTGCKGCYAEALATTRLGRQWGPGAERRVTSPANWKLPARWARAAAKAECRRKVFCASLADVLDVEAPKEAQVRLWQLIRETANVRAHDGRSCPIGPHVGHEHHCHFGLDWLLLTKRPERWELIPEDVRALVWFGTSISDQETANEWVPRLLAAEGMRVRFLSAEPQVGPIDLRRWIGPAVVGTLGAVEIDANWGISWVIGGGESSQGKHVARPYDLAWPRTLLEQCRAAREPFFHKQLGDRPVASLADLPYHPTGKGDDPAEWPPDLRVREFPNTTGARPQKEQR